MKLKWLISTTAIALLIAVAFLGLAGHDSVVAAQDTNSKIEGMLLDRFTTDGSADFIVRFTQQADLSAAYAMDWNARGEFVYNTLRETAANSQVNAKAILDVAGLKYHTFIGGNELYVWSGSLTVATDLAALPEVGFIRATRTFYVDPYIATTALDNISWAGDFLAKNALTTVGNPNATTDWGITDTKADQAWLLGARGSGIKVANIDTGVQWDHPALVNQFACPGDPSNPACWSDPSNICGGSACDNAGHGTHTMGTMVGLDDPSLPYIVGMAPDATWIACKGCESSSCSDFALTSCADWILAPGGDPANRPNVVNNSWGGGGGDNWYLTYVNNWRAAGIFPAFSAGNSGPGCSTLGSPGDYQESFASAAHDSTRTIASFSSRGPSAFGHDPYTKPNISAPGVNICSSVPTNGWSCGYSGTSMASPHTAGAVAQLWSCDPGLVGQIDATFQALQASVDSAPAGNCGAPPDGQGNYTYGYGYLDVLNLVSTNCGVADIGTLNGHVYDQNANPVEGATVTAVPGIEGNQIQATTDPTGYYTMTLVAGTYNVTASKVNYTPQTVNGVVVQANQNTTQDFTLTFLGGWTQLTPGVGCPDWYRYDMEYYAGTGLAYIMGGRSGTITDGTIYSYNPLANTCASTGLTMPVPISNYTIVTLNNGSADLLCTFGGRDSGGGYSTAVQCFNPNTNAVSTVSTLPGELGSFIPGGAAVVDNIAYVFGGFRNTTSPYTTAQTWAYDPVANTWTQKGNLTLGRGYIEVAVADGKIYGFGGDTFDGTNLVAQTIAEVYDPVAGTWDDAAVADLATPSGEGRGFGFDTASGYELAGQIVLAGGGIWQADTNAVLLYDIASNTYDETFPDLNVERRDFGAFFVPSDPGRMFVMGGFSALAGYGGDNPPYAPPEYKEVIVTTPKPKIGVTPASLSATLLPTSTLTMPITITNSGNAPLSWSIIEMPGMKVSAVSAPRVVQNAANPVFTGTPVASHPTEAKPVAPYKGPLAVLYDQTDNPAGNGFTSQDFEPAFDTYDDQGADDFTVPTGVSAWSIESLYIPGVNSGTAVPAVNVYFYIDNAGLPGAQVYLASGVVPVDDGTGNLSITLPTVAVLPPGNYWVSVQAVMDFGTYGQWYWSTRSIQTANPWAWQNPGDGFGSGCTTWAYGVSGCGITGGPDALFRLEGTALADVPWLSENPTSGTVPAGESVVVQVTFDSTGLTPGQYLASLDVNSNDPATPVVNVPVSLTVQSVDLALTKTDDPDPVRASHELTYTLLVSNLGIQDSTGSVVTDTLPAGVTFVRASAGCTQLAGVVTCDVGALASGDAAEITIVVVPNNVGLIENTATVTGKELDPNLANNTATQETTVIPAILNIYLPLIMKTP